MSREVILGIDPGTLITGYGLVACQNDKLDVLDFGCIKPKPAFSLSDRYIVIFQGVKELIEKYKPSSLAIETQYVKNNPQSAIKLGMARGVIVLAAKLHGLKVYEYTPSKVKLSVTGKGQASKYQVKRMTMAILGLDSLPDPEDISDALACAICHSHSIKMREETEEF